MTGIVWELVQLSRNDRVVPERNEVVRGIYVVVKQKQRGFESRAVGSTEEGALQKEECGHSERVRHGNLPYPSVS